MQHLIKDTPRTDEFILHCVRTDYNWRILAKRLERELNEAKAENEAMREAIKLYMQIIGSPDVQPSEHWSDDDDLAQAWDKGQEALKGAQP